MIGRVEGPGRVLLVEDERLLRRALAMNLSARGWQVTEAADGTTGLAAAASTDPQVVVLDLGLPDLDGVDVVRGIRAWSTTPILVLSARTDSLD
jgi:two-component system, OmpR family, KDP operon response regulator KdpE